MGLPALLVLYMSPLLFSDAVLSIFCVLLEQLYIACPPDCHCLCICAV